MHKDVALALLLASFGFSTPVLAQQLPTSGVVNSPLGKLTFRNGYGPTQPYFDRTWVLPDVEVIK